MHLNNCNIITIDGESASGKSSVAEEISLQLGYVHLDSGIIFRTMGYLMDKYAIDLSSLAKSLDQYEIMNEVNIVGQKVFDNGLDISNHIQSESSGLRAADLGRYEYFQNWFINYLRTQVANLNGSCVVSGRIGGTLIFPQAELKFYLTADIQTKASRRYNQLVSNRLFSFSFDDVVKSINSRDDLHKILHYWKFSLPEDSIVINTTSLAISQVVNKINLELSRNGCNRYY